MYLGHDAVFNLGPSDSSAANCGGACTYFIEVYTYTGSSSQPFQLTSKLDHVHRLKFTFYLSSFAAVDLGAGPSPSPSHTAQSTSTSSYSAVATPSASYTPNYKVRYRCIDVHVSLEAQT